MRVPRVEFGAFRGIVAFGLVGILATIVHVIVGLALVAAGLFEPFNANIVAFLTAFVVSYFGHRRFSFQSNARHERALPRFLFVAALGLMLNQLIVHMAVDRAGWSYSVALAIVVIVVPGIVYMAGKFWAFRETAT